MTFVKVLIFRAWVQLLQVVRLRHSFGHLDARFSRRIGFQASHDWNNTFRTEVGPKALEIAISYHFLSVFLSWTVHFCWLNLPCLSLIWGVAPWPWQTSNGPQPSRWCWWLQKPGCGMDGILIRIYSNGIFWYMYIARARVVQEKSYRRSCANNKPRELQYLLHMWAPHHLPSKVRANFSKHVGQIDGITDMVMLLSCIYSQLPCIRER